MCFRGGGACEAQKARSVWWMRGIVCRTRALAWTDAPPRSIRERERESQLARGEGIGNPVGWLGLARLDLSWGSPSQREGGERSHEHSVRALSLPASPPLLASALPLFAVCRHKNLMSTHDEKEHLERSGASYTSFALAPASASMEEFPFPPPVGLHAALPPCLIASLSFCR